MLYLASELALLDAALVKQIEINSTSDFIPLNLTKFDYKQFKDLCTVIGYNILS